MLWKGRCPREGDRDTWPLSGKGIAWKGNALWKEIFWKGDTLGKETPWGGKYHGEGDTLRKEIPWGGSWEIPGGGGDTLGREIVDTLGKEMPWEGRYFGEGHTLGGTCGLRVGSLSFGRGY